MTWQPASTHPTQPGWYLVRLRLSERPVVLWWATLSTAWRDGMRAVEAVQWCGPL